MTDSKFRTEKDSMGELNVPADALYGAQTQRAVENFPISGLTLPDSFIHALGLIKAACASANVELGLLDKDTESAIRKASLSVANGEYDAHFPVDVFQTGSGTSTNMNVNEVISRLASSLADQPVHPNDHVNMSQSSNDVIPTAIHVSACLQTEQVLKPALVHLVRVMREKASQNQAQVKTGRTHLMDAMPVTLGQEIEAWAQQVEYGIERIEHTLMRLRQLAQGHFALGNENPRGQIAIGGVGCRRRAGVARGGAHHPDAALFQRLGHGHHHAPVLERSGGVAALQLEVQVGAPKLRSKLTRPHQRRVALTHRKDGCLFVDRQQVPVLL